eukprot:CAMPEP_0168490908 /NCGR_PEP_ID=MMETSP0228-20121227/69426_1 /TAXON_ID=133427 /ORGANISM="Protoceratium reticulatum, Strain CCCM 535 (=CCMP 1889)" /LENGTH=53 /DNA_ID=CAMNT_0008507635 /DNA_START=72 /DNA_END=231 /DNA_ORIENTATION=-
MQALMLMEAAGLKSRAPLSPHQRVVCRVFMVLAQAKSGTAASDQLYRSSDQLQ